MSTPVKPSTPSVDQMNSSEKNRLDRIEEKIDKMAEAVIALARAEEKISSLSETTHVILKRLVEYDNRMRVVEKQSSESASKLKTITAFIWTVITAITVSIISAVSWIGSK